MDKRRPVQADFGAGAPENRPDAASDRFREAMARWAATVTLVAARDGDGRVHATTVSSFAPLSADPPLVVVCLGAGAQVLPFAAEGGRLGVSLLAEDQSRWATIYADPYPVRAPEWTSGPAPLLPDAVAALSCTVRAVHPTDAGSRVLICRVDAIERGDGERPLLYWRRGYRRLAAE